MATTTVTELNGYNNSIIYSINSHKTDKVYIGASIKSLSYIDGDYKKKYIKYLDGKFDESNISSFQIIKQGDAYIKLIERVNCNNRSELNQRLGEIIRLNADIVVNIDKHDVIKEKVERYNDKTWKPKVFNNIYLGTMKTCKCKSSYKLHEEQEHMKSKDHIAKVNGTYVREEKKYYPMPEERCTDGLYSCYSSKGFSNV